ncbi:hypothetical protein [Paenibacillus rubinfantis]|uniref:hypothetical protein n=1 Tax=Paenibacillus rubinfantis TaxID=1720296 RepID=UPI00073E14C9|nr:hypothetical protein [Paenibacillus rubinfantis]
MSEFEYEAVIQRLKDSFPEGTVKFRSDSNAAYIPNQVYTDRLEAVTQGRWNKAIKDVEINVQHKYVKVVVTITIGEHHRDGFGFSYIDSDGQGRPKIGNALDQAAASAFIEALDSWQMGWKDLAPHYKKDWGSNPALKHLVESGPPADRSSGQIIQSRAKVDRHCIYTRCGKQLTEDEWELLKVIPNLNRDKMVYCYDHLPDHLKRKVPERDMSAFLRKREAGG